MYSLTEWKKFFTIYLYCIYLAKKLKYLYNLIIVILIYLSTIIFNKFKFLAKASTTLVKRLWKLYVYERYGDIGIYVKRLDIKKFAFIDLSQLHWFYT